MEQIELGDDEMLTLIRMAGWDMRRYEPYETYLIDPHGAAIMVPYLSHQRPVQTLFNEFLRFKQYL